MIQAYLGLAESDGTTARFSGLVGKHAAVSAIGTVDRSAIGSRRMERSVPSRAQFREQLAYLTCTTVSYVSILRELSSRTERIRRDGIRL